MRESVDAALREAKRVKRLRLSFLVVAAPAAMVGCQMIAGIEDLQLTSTPDAAVGSSASDEAAADMGGFADSGGLLETGASDDGSRDGRDTTAETSSGEAADAMTDVTMIDGRAADAGGPDRLAGDASADATADVADGAREGAPESGGDSGPTDLVDDLESDDGHIIPTHGRSGSWYTYSDGTDGGVLRPAAGAPFLPAPTMPALGTSKYSAEVTATGFASFAGMGFNLNAPVIGPEAGVVSTYDASAYVGLTFYARVGPGSPTRVRIGFPDANTQASGNTFGAFLTLSTDWTEQVVKFADLHQENFGKQFPAFDAQHVYGVNFQVDATGGVATFDLWVDNIAFMTR